VESLWSGSIEGWSEPAPRARRRRLIADEATAEPAAPSPLPVEVVRSAKRRKSVAARIVDGRIVVRVPQWMSKAQEAEHVAALVAKLERQRTSTVVDLPSRARLLARRYDLPVPASIRWVSNQRSRWGSCTPAHGEIRISDRIAGFPDWVVDAVIVHELAHLVHLDHSPAFWELAHRYPRTERALGFLIAKQVTDDDLGQP
jgi:predicted metal-dependent hydrolase